MAIQLSTPVTPEAPRFAISHSDSILLLGSCFTDHIGLHLRQAGFSVMSNPFGVLYNPASIATCLRRATAQHAIADTDIVLHDGYYHSWLHHGSFSSPQRDVCIERCNRSFADTRSFLQQCSTVIITLGTAYVYHRLVDGRRGPVVANCHRFPADTFERRRLSIEECVQALVDMPLEGKRVILTVSPIRHLADGAHANQLSKATLLLAVEQFIDHHPDAYYFPAYEILLDELRDYRFYDRDLAHPSQLAIDIIWQRFQDTFFSPATQNLCRHHEKAFRQQQHRPIAGGQQTENGNQ